MGKPDTWQPAPDTLNRWGPKPKLRVVEMPPWVGWHVRSEAAQAIRWIETYLTVPTGHRAGQAFQLAAFQKRIVRTLFDSIVTFVSIPAGNGKTTLLSALAIARLVRGDQFVEVDVVATKWDQASILVEQAKRLVETCPAVAEQFVWYAKPGILEYRPTGSRLRAHPARLSSLQGLAPNLAILDEAGFLPDELAEALIARAVKQPDMRIVGIGTPGLESGNLLHRLKREHEDDALPPGVRYLEWSAPDDADVHDRRAWRKANPALQAGFMNIDALAMQAQLMPERTFATYSLGRWVDQASSWLPASAWESNPLAQAPADGADVVISVWGTYRRTLSVIGCGLDGTVFHCWAAEAATDDELHRVLDECAARWNVLEVTHLRRIRTAVFAELHRAGLPVEAWPADADTEATSANELYRAIIDGRVPHDHHELLAEHMRNARARHAVDGSLRLLQPDDGTHADAALAARAAWWRAFVLAEQISVEPPRIY